MRFVFLQGAMLALFLSFPVAAVAQADDLDALRAELDALRADYDTRIAELERRLAVAEQNAEQATYAAQQAGAAPAASGNSAFNPAIGVIFQGQAWGYSQDPDSYEVRGFPLGGEAGLFDEGLSLGETELIMNANVDDKFTAWLTAALALEDGEAAVEIEEAWVETTALPAGLGARFGRFYSGIGYLNSKHAHSWDFADLPLPYKAFLANQYVDNGVQLRWLAPTETFLELGGEVLQGSAYPAAGSAHSGFGSTTLFVNVGGDIGTDSSWLAGVSYLDATAIDREAGDEDDPFLFTGDTRLAGAQFIWKWSPQGNWKDRNFIFQTEVFQRREEGLLTAPGGAPSPYDVTEEGWYAQAVYQPFPRWRFGGRADGLSSDAEDPRRYTVMMDWSNSEFSRFRLQFTRDEAGPLDDNQWGLQYIHSIGAHGAHTF